MKRKLTTLVFIERPGEILLGMKKRGFGAGRWNGFGGKVEERETIEESAIREMCEECGITITKLEEVGLHEFEFDHERGSILEVHVFRGTEWSGEPEETEEMRPAWFPIDRIPFDEMWPDDRYWFPVFLLGKKFHTYFLFDKDDQILKKRVLVLGDAE